MNQLNYTNYQNHQSQMQTLRKKMQITQSEINEYLSGRFPPESDKAVQIKQYLNFDFMYQNTPKYNFATNPNDINLINKQQTNFSQQCSICWDFIYKINNEVFKTQCQHYFHQHCINQWRYQQLIQDMQVSCPMCRSII